MLPVATPTPPYTAVIFTSQRAAGSSPDDGYAAAADAMDALARRQPGYLGLESARDSDGFGITASYWLDDDSARAWKAVAEHAAVQQLGRDRWYAAYRVRVARVEREYGFGGAES